MRTRLRSVLRRFFVVLLLYLNLKWAWRALLVLIARRLVVGLWLILLQLLVVLRTVLRAIVPARSWGCV